MLGNRSDTRAPSGSDRVSTYRGPVPKNPIRIRRIRIRTRHAIGINRMIAGRVSPSVVKIAGKGRGSVVPRTVQRCIVATLAGLECARYALVHVTD
jgi:hypothetical protein